MNDQYLRLQCLKMIVDGGSHHDRANPEPKAEAYYNFVMGKTKPVPKPVSLEEVAEPPKKKPGRPKKVIQAPEVDTVVGATTSSPFGNSGRPVEVIQ